MNNNGDRPPRASDYYVPVSLIVTGIGTVSSVVMILTPMFGSLSSIENRITKLETRLESKMESFAEAKKQIDQLEEKCRNGR